ncbi:MAG TPA: hypothetical protein VNK82_12045 [Terriglobales bacterium]|nr:hypothetical protein [Terriglobales bacterium]
MNLWKSNSLMFLFGFGIGAGVMFLLDPERGRHRRAVLREKAVETLEEIETKAAETASGVVKRARGLAVEARRAL